MDWSALGVEVEVPQEEKTAGSDMPVWMMEAKAKSQARRGVEPTEINPPAAYSIPEQIAAPVESQDKIWTLGEQSRKWDEEHKDLIALEKKVKQPSFLPSYGGVSVVNPYAATDEEREQWGAGKDRWNAYQAKSKELRGAMDEEMKSLSKDYIHPAIKNIDDAIEKTYKERPQITPDKNDYWGHVARGFVEGTKPLGMTDLQTDAKVRTLKQAKKLLEKADKRANAPSDGGGIGAVWQGLKPVDVLDFVGGFNDMLAGYDLDNVLKKLEYEPSSLTLEEQMLIVGKFTQDMVNSNKTTSGAYNIGEGAAESIPFMVDMALAYATGGGSLASKGIAKGAMSVMPKLMKSKAFAGWLGRIGRGGVRVVQSAATAVADAAAMPSTYKRIGEDMAGGLQVDPLGGIERVGQQGVLSSLGGSVIETHSERAGEVFSAWGRQLTKSLPLPRIAKQFMLDARSGKQVARQFFHAAGKQASPWEYAEEKYGEALNVITRDEGSWKDFFDAQKNWETLGVTLLVGAGQSMITAPGEVHRAHVVRKARARVNDAIETAQGVMSEEQLNEVRDALNQSTFELQGAALGKIKLSGYSKSQREALGSMVSAKLAYDAVRGASQMDMEPVSGGINEMNAEEQLRVRREYVLRDKQELINHAEGRVTTAVDKNNPDTQYNITSMSTDDGVVAVYNPITGEKAQLPIEQLEIVEDMTVDEFADQVLAGMEEQKKQEKETPATDPVAPSEQTMPQVDDEVNAGGRKYVVTSVEDVTGSGVEVQVLDVEHDEVRSMSLEEFNATYKSEAASVNTLDGESGAASQDVAEWWREQPELLVQVMEQNAEPARMVELTPETWEAEFGGEDGAVKTPLGDVKMGDNQYYKIVKNGRQKEFGMIKPTLTNPDVIIEVPSESKDGNTERGSSYLFVKTFRYGNETVKFFTSVTVSKGGMEVVISNHIESLPRMRGFLKNGNLLYQRADMVPGADASSPTSTGQATEADSDAGTSENKDTTISPESQDVALKSVPKDAKGNYLFEQVEPGVAAEAIKALVGDNAMVMVKAAQAAAERSARKLVDEHGQQRMTGDMNKDIANQVKTEQVKAKVQFWSNVYGELAREAEESAIFSQEEQVRKGTTFTKRLNTVEANTPVSIRDVILRQIAHGVKFVWEDTHDNRGIGGELFGKPSAEERKERASLLSKDGISIDRLAEHIYSMQEANDAGVREIPDFGMDVNDIRSEVIDVLHGVKSASEALTKSEELQAQSSNSVDAKTQEVAVNAMVAELDKIPDTLVELLYQKEVDAQDLTLDALEQFVNENVGEFEGFPYDNEQYVEIKTFLENARKQQSEQQEAIARRVQEELSGAYSGERGAYYGEEGFGGDTSQAVSSEVDAEVAERMELDPDKAANAEIAKAEQRVDVNPTEAQKEAGNYQKGHVVVNGLEITIEQPKGSVRSGVDENGRAWSTTMNNTYGYFKGTKGKDGDHIDVFLGDKPSSRYVFVVDQVSPDTGEFDEHKVMLGFETADEARTAYLSNYEQGWNGLGAITTVELEDFRGWVESDTRRVKPFADYKQVQDAVNEISQLKNTLGKLKPGETAHMERVFSEKHHFGFCGTERVETLDDVACIFNKLEDAAVENSFMVLVKDGRAIVLHLGIGDFNAVVVNFPAAIEGVKRVSPDQIYFVHNHPSGEIFASKEDKRMHEKLVRAFGDKVQPSVIINLKTGRYGVYEGGYSDEHVSGSSETDTPIPVYAFDKVAFAKEYNPRSLSQIKQGGDVAEFISSQRLGDRDKLSYLVLDRQCRVVGNFFTDAVEIVADNVDALAEDMASHAITYGGVSVIPFGRLSYEGGIPRKLSTLVQAKSGDSVKVLDVLNVGSGTYESALDSGAMEGEVAYSPTEKERSRTNAHNDKFNTELQQQMDGTLPKGHVYQLGKSSDILQSAGIPALPIELQASRLSDKSMQENHPFNLSEVSDLPQAIQSPLAVFDSATKDGSFVILTEILHGDKNYIVAIEANRKVGKIEVNSVRSVHYRNSNSHIANWINDGLVRYVNKQKMSEWFSKQRYNSADVKGRFTRATKIIQNFENPTVDRQISDKKFKPISKEVFGALVERLKETGLAKDVVTDRAKMEEFLSTFDKKHGTRFLSVWHGSPHTFDKFLMSKMDTGEGNQSYGAGLYFTSKRKIAEEYAERLSDTQYELRYKGKPASDIEKAAHNMFSIHGAQSVEEAIEQAKEARGSFKGDAEVEKIYDGIIGVLSNSKMSDFSEERVPTGSLYKVKIHEGKDVERLDFIRWDKEITRSQLNKIELALKKQYPNFDWENAGLDLHDMIEATGEEVYRAISNYLEDFSDSKQEADKLSSDLLLKGGIDGIQYPSEYQSRGSHEDSFNYVVFDESAIEIEERIQFMRTPMGEVYGFVTADGVVYLDPEKVNANTPIHEFGHLWNGFVKKNNPELYARGAQLIKDSSYWKKVNSNPAYAKLSEEQKVDEALAWAIGDKGELTVGNAQSASSSIKEWLSKLWEWIGGKLGIRNLSSEQIQGLTLEQFAEGAVADLLNGEKIEKAINSNNFEKWFGDWKNNPSSASRVIDDSGNPKVVYHGTNQDIDRFRNDRLGQNTGAMSATAFFFTENAIEAEEYANMSARKQVSNSIEREENAERLLREIEKAYSRGNFDLAEKLELELEESEREAMTGEERGASILPVFLNIRNPMVVDMNHGSDLVYLADKIEEAKEKGYDGLKLENVFDPVDNRSDLFSTTQWVAFEATQVKSATGNTGEFNSENADIRYQSEEQKQFSDVTNQRAKEAKIAYDAKKKEVAQKSVDAMLGRGEGVSEADMSELDDLSNETQPMFQVVQEVNNVVEESSGKLKSWAKDVHHRMIDSDVFVKDLQELVQKLGGKVGEAEDVYNEINRSMGIVTYRAEHFEKNEWEQLSKALKAIVEKTKNAGVVDGEGVAITPYRALTLYMQAKDMVEGKEFGLPDRGYAGFLDAMGRSAEAYIGEYEALIGNMADELWNATRAATHFALDCMYAGDLITAKERAEYKRRMYYVPQRGWEKRAEEEEGGEATHYLKDFKGAYHHDPFNKVTKRAKGRKSLAEDPLPFIESMAHSAIVAAEKNLYKQRALNLVRKNLELGREQKLFNLNETWLVNAGVNDATGEVDWKEVFEKPNQELIAKGVEIEKEITEQKKLLAYHSRKKNMEKVNAIAKKIEDLERQIPVRRNVAHGLILQRTKTEEQQHYVEVYEDGVRYKVFFNDERVSNAINKADIGHNSTMLFNVIGKTNRYLASVLTQYNPAFAAWNFGRDFGFANLTNLADKGVVYTMRFNKNVVTSQAAIMRYLVGKPNYNKLEDVQLRSFFENGAATGFTYLKDLDQLGRDIKRMAAPSAWDIIAHGKYNPVNFTKNLFAAITEGSELTSRFATFRTTLEVGGTERQAAIDAKNCTVNFNRKGTQSPMWNSAFMFFNATVQGGMRGLEITRKNKGKIAAMSTGLFVMGYINTLLTMDGDDDDKKWTEFDRRQNAILFGVKVPLPHYFRAIWAWGVEAALASSGRKSVGNAIFDSLQLSTSELLPNAVNPLAYVDWSDKHNSPTITMDGAVRNAIPSILLPAVEVAMLNKDFAGRSIYREPMRDKERIPHAFWGKKNTAGWAQVVSNAALKLGGGNTDVEDTRIGSTDKFVSPALDNLLLSPGVIEHLVTSYTGGVGKFFSDVSKAAENVWQGEPIDPANIPVYNRMVKEYNEDKYFERQYYSLLNWAQDYEHSIKANQKAMVGRDGKKNETAVENYRKLTMSQRNGINLRMQGVATLVKKMDEITDQMSNGDSNEAALRKQRKEFMKQAEGLRKELEGIKE